MKNKKIVLTLIVIVLCTFTYNTFFPKFLITGKYQSEISNTFGADGIEDGEDLIINSDNTFSSDSWGNGTYKLEHGFKGTRIDFSFGNEGNNTYFYRPFFFGNPRIVIFRDLSSEFVKIE